MSRRPRIEDLTDLAIPEQPALSPDANQVVYVLRTDDVGSDRPVRNLWKVPADKGPAVQLTRGGSDSAPAWSPDGEHVAFLRSQEGVAQLWLLPTGGGEAEQLTTLPHGAGGPVWSPDGSRLAFAAAVDIAATTTGDEGVRSSIDSAPRVAERLDYQADGAGLLATMRSHLHVLDLSSRECRPVTEGDWHAGGPAWSPDGTKLVFAAAREPDSDLTSRSRAYVVKVDEPGSAPAPVGPGDGVAATVIWTADGENLVIAGYAGEPFGHIGLQKSALDGSKAVDLAGSLDRNVMTGGPGYPGALPQLSQDGRRVLFCVRDRGCTHLYEVGIDGGTPRALVAGEGRNVSGLSVSRTRAAIALGTPSSLGEIVVLDLATGTETVRTEHGASWDDVDLYERESREFRISDGTTVHAWIMRDPEAKGPGPLLLDIHGGPHNAWNGAADGIHLYHHELVARGWTVLLVNPRGSDGYGEQFYSAAIGAWGVEDAKDFLEPLDDLVAEGVADPGRLAVTGYSYGGFMTCYLTSRDNRFAAAVAGGVVSDLTSLAGTSDLGHFMDKHELGSLHSADPARFAEMSPLTHVDRVRTPTLIAHGGSDLRCPVGQAQQWHSALREQGVTSRLVLYPGGSHLFILDGLPSHRLDYNRRLVDWVEQHAAPTEALRRPRIDLAHWQRRLDILAAKHNVPGATLGLLRIRPGRDEELVQAAHGVLNIATRVETTTDSLFQIGSISKVWTATVAMQLVDEGLLDLDAPIVDVLPDLQLSSPEVTKSVTMRHLLTHTSGIDGDVFTDTGRDDDCLERYVAGLAEVAQSHPVGATWSYCNSGFTLIGRVIEKLTGLTWDEAIRVRITVPLGLQHTVTLPEDALLHRAAVGHVDAEDGQQSVAPVWSLPRSLGPAGLISSSVADLLGFARLHLAGGKGPDGQVLSESSAAAMTIHQADVPDKYSLGDSWGLGWIRFGWDGNRVIGHDGNTIGQAAFLRVLPEQGLAVGLLTNGGNAGDLYRDLYREIFAEVAGVAMPSPLAAPSEPLHVDVARHAGSYRRAGTLMEVSGGDAPVLKVTLTDEMAEINAVQVMEFGLEAVDPTGDLFVVHLPGTQTWMPVTFYSLPTGERYLHLGARATPRVA